MSRIEDFKNLPRKVVVFLDNDSTIMTGEIIDTLGEILGKKVQYEIENITNSQMNGDSQMSFKESLEKRIDILIKNNLSQNDIKRCVKKMKFSEGFENFLQEVIKKEGTLLKNVYILSGGFLEVIIGKIQELSILEKEKKILSSQVYANEFLYTKTGEIIGLALNTPYPMYTQTAKKDIIKMLIQTQKIAGKKVLAIGDGANDVKMVEENDTNSLFVAYTGVVSRPQTIKASQGRVFTTFFEVRDFLYK